jgi:hypothetical protein
VVRSKANCAISGPHPSLDRASCQRGAQDARSLNRGVHVRVVHPERDNRGGCGEHFLHGAATARHPHDAFPIHPVHVAFGQLQSPRRSGALTEVRRFALMERRRTAGGYLRHRPTRSRAVPPVLPLAAAPAPPVPVPPTPPAAPTAGLRGASPPPSAAQPAITSAIKIPNAAHPCCMTPI